MKILYFSPHPQLNLGAQTGYATHMREVIKGLEDLGHQVRPVILGGTEMPEKAGISASTKKAGGIKQKIKKLIPPKLWQTLKDQRLVRFDAYAYRTLSEEIDHYSPDVIYERGFYLMTSGVRAAKLKGIPHMMEINAPFSKERPVMEGSASYYGGTALKCEKVQADQTQVISVVSSAIKAYYADTHGVEGDKIRVIPNAVNPSYDSDAEAGKELKSSFGWRPDDVVIGFVGSIFPYHGVELLIETFIELSAESANLRLLIVGDGASLPAMEVLVLAAGIGDKIKFTGKVNHKEVFPHMSAMDICVMADSNWYGSPVKIFEYGLAKKVVVAPNNVPVRDVMEHGVHGLLTSNDKVELKRHLNKLIDSEELRIKLSSAWNKKVVDQHLWKHVAQEVEGHLKSILE